MASICISVSGDWQKGVPQVSVLLLLEQSRELIVKETSKWFLSSFREVATTVKLSPDVIGEVRVLLIHRWPRGVYVDPYQLASLSHHSDWQVS